MYKWEKEKSNKPEWVEAKECAVSGGLYYYEQLLKAGMIGAEFKVNDMPAKIDKTLIIFAMKTRFHKIYGDKQDIKHTGDVSISFDKSDENL